MLVGLRGEASLVPSYFCDVLTSRHSRYRVRRFEPWASAQRLMARLEIEVFPNKSVSTTCFHNHPTSRNSLRPVDLICFGNVKPVSPLTPVVLFAQHERGEVWASSYPEAFGNGEVTPSAWPGPGLLLRLINLWRLNAVVIQRHSCRTRSSPREKNCRIP